MNRYFTISKFARLRGIDINSLRYYERLGILIPAYTDPHTRYRYYTAFDSGHDSIMHQSGRAAQGAEGLL